MSAEVVYDSLLLGSATLEDAGCYSLSKKPSQKISPVRNNNEPGPGLLQQMAVCLPFEYIYVHGDLGIIEKAKRQVYNDGGPIVIELPAAHNAHNPERLLIASVDEEYDTGVLGELLTDCKKKNPGFQAYLAGKETLGNSFCKKHEIVCLKETWEDYLDSPGFQEYYQARLARLFKEQRRWPRVPDFTGRERELAELVNAVRRFAYVQVDGGVGSGKSTLLAKMAENNPSNQNVIWIQANSRFISKAEVILSMAIQLGLLPSATVLEKENLKAYLPKLERDIDERLRNNGALIVFDSLDPFLNQGVMAFENKELKDLLFRWVSDNKGMGRAKLVFTADLRIKDTEKDSFKKLKTSFTNVVRRREQKIFLTPMDPKARKVLFLKWLQSVSSEPGFRQWADRLFNIGGNNLRLLRLLAFWACHAKGVEKIEKQIQDLEKTKPWDKENFVYRNLFKTIGPQKEAILKTLEWVGKPVPKTVLCSSAGMNEALEGLLREGLLMANQDDTIELVYRFGKDQPGKTWNLSNRGFEDAISKEIRAFRRLGNIEERNTGQAINFFSAGNAICERTGWWEEWKEAPIINLSAFISRARTLVKQANHTSVPFDIKQKMAQQAIGYCTKSIEANIELGDSHFFYAQAMEILYPYSREDDIKTYYKQAIVFKPRPDKYSRFAIFTYKRLKHFEQAERLFKKANEKNFNIFGLRAQAEFYLNWDGHEIKAGDILNRVIIPENNELQNFFLAGRLFHKLNWEFLTDLFSTECLSIDGENIQALNNYAEACGKWGRVEKAKELFEKSISLNAKNVPTLNSYANACVRWGDAEKAKELFERSLSLNANNVLMLHSYANACVKWKNPEKAKESFEKALRLQPDNIQVLNSYANACLEWEEKEKSKELFEKALKINDKDIKALTSYANACVQWKEDEKAKEYFEKARALEPENKIVKECYDKARKKWSGKNDTNDHITTPTPKTQFPFTFTPEEKTWLITFTGKKQIWAGAKDLAGFCMLYTIYYLKGELNSTANLGWIPSLENEYHRLHNTVNDLLIMLKAIYKPSQSIETPLYWLEEWFEKKGEPFDLISYYDEQLLHYPQNPVCGAFLCQALESFGWDKIATQFKNKIIHWLRIRKNEWQPFMKNTSIDLFTSQGKERFHAFLEELVSQPDTETLKVDVEPITQEAVANFLDRFSVTWQKMPSYFPCWQQLNPTEQNLALGKLLDLFEKLKNLLNNIINNEENAFIQLKTFAAEDIKIPATLMKRLYDYTAKLEKPEPIPWYVSGEILAVKETALLVRIERANLDGDEEREIPLTEFPAANRKKGKRFFAKIQPNNPEILYDIEFLEYPTRNFEEVFISLFGEETYEKAAAHWVKEDEHA